MATIILARQMAIGETRTFDVDFTPDLREGVTVQSANASHFPPSGTPSTPAVGVIANNIVPVTLSGITVTGMHQLKTTATLTDGDATVVVLMIPVNT